MAGLVLFAYVAMHLANHALGLVSLAAMEGGRVWFLALWRNPAGTVLLYGAIAAHLLLALWALYQRRSLRMRPWKAAQLALGLAIPPLIVEHLLGTRLAFELFDLNDLYARVLLILWELAPEKGLTQSAVLLLAWSHGCVGLHFWLRFKQGYYRWAPYCLAVAVLLPVLALLGFVEGGREISELMRDPVQREALMATINATPDEAVALIGTLKTALWLGFLALLLATLAARAIRALVARRHGIIRITYPAGRRVEIPRGHSVLEASRSANIPHASVCGGRGRCSTCRIRISAGADDQPQPSPEECRVLERVGAPPDVRLACQLRPTRPLTVAPLLPASASPVDAHARPGYLQGREQEIAILFADLRAFTRLAEQKLPYDVVFILNRYFAAMGQAVEEAGGHLDKFIGDGVMALFGVKSDAADGCRRALSAARGMADNLRDLNESLAHDLPAPLRIGIGIHVGPAIIGEMGYGRANSLTAVGDAVNTASRLEGLSKEFTAELIVSEAVATRAGLDLSGFTENHVEIRGREERLPIRIIPSAGALAAVPGIDLKN